MILHPLQLLILWVIVSTVMVGGAILFHRFFPDESPWFGFVIPALALVLLCNFIEHFLALPGFLILLPVVLGGTLWMIVGKGWFQPALTFPTLVFLGSFAFTFGIRCLQPNIDWSRPMQTSGPEHEINNYSQGHTGTPDRHLDA